MYSYNINLYKEQNSIMMFKKLSKAIYILAIVALLVVIAAALVACNKNVTLYFETNGGDAIGAITAKGLKDITLPELGNKVENGVTYVFDGWSLNSDLSGDVYRGTVTAPKSNTTFYARWERGYRLTLNAGSGKLKDDQLSRYLKAGASILDAVKDIVPTVEGDLTFSDWYLGAERVKDTTLMPDSNATLTARYNVGYTIAYYLQDYDGEYQEKEELTKTRFGLVGVQASEDQTDIVIEGYYYNEERSEETNRITLTENASLNVLKYYYDIDGYHVTYNANPPQGLTAQGEMKEGIAGFDDEPLKAADCEFTVDGYRFLGWAYRALSYSPTNNTIECKVGEDIEFLKGENALVLYAIWQPGAADALGGSDYLFVEPDYEADDNTITTRKVYLVRDRVEEKTGEFDPKTGVFTFKEGNNVVLKGVLNIETNYFYYYNATLYQEYHSKDDNTKSITIDQDYAATYKNGEKQTSGKVTYDTEWGYYVFTSEKFDDETASADEKIMLRFQFEENEQGETVLAFQNMDEAGYYATADGYPVIYLDGLGSFRYFYDPEHPTYYDITNEPVLETNGIYYYADGHYVCSMHAGDPTNPDTHLEDFAFRILEGTEAGKSKIDAGSNPNFPAEFEIDDIKSNAIERSTFYGQLSDDLYLDGFGGGTYTERSDENDEIVTEHKGTYTIVHNFWMTENSAEADQVWLINFYYDGATEDIYFAIRQSRSGTMTAQYFGSVSPRGGDGGLWIFDGSVTLDGKTYGDAFIMFLLNKPNETMLLVEIDEKELGSGEKASIYAPMYTGTVTKTGNTFTFISVSNDAQLSFEFKEEKNGNKYAHVVTGTGEGTQDDRVIADNLTVHPATGTATYTDAQGTVHNDVRYTYSGSEYIEFYTFNLDDTHNLYYYRDAKNKAEKFMQISGDRLLDYAYITEDVMFAYPARLLLADGGKAFIALPMAIGEPVYVGLGTYTEADGLYSVEFSDWRDDTELLDFFGGEGYESSLRTFHEYYNSFNFRKEGGSEDETGEFYVRFDKRFNDDLGDMYFDLSNFKTDGYSNSATYTLDSGYVLEGTFYRMDIVIVFEVRDSDDRVISSYYLKEDTANNRMKNVSEDAGLYYFYDIDSTSFETFGPDYGGSLTDYIIYDGEDSVTVVDIQEDYLENKYDGTMTKTPNWTEDFREYEIHETDSGKIYRVLLGSFVSVWHDEYLVYDLQSSAYSGEYLTEEYGVLKGNGYRLNSATYDKDGDGVADYTGLMVRATFDEKDIQTHAYTVDENGDVIVFTYKVDEEISESFVFDAITDVNGNIMYLKERKLRFGAFAAWDVGKRTGEYMYLDGQGNAELYDADGTLSGEGTYEAAPEISETSYQYMSGDGQQTFYFAIYIESEEGGNTYFEFRRYEERVEGEYDAEDWSHLTMNGFGEITYTDRYGVVYEGYYDMIDSAHIMLITYDGSGVTFTFTFAYSEDGNGTFQFDSQGKIEVPEEPAEPAPTEPAGEE